MDAFPEEGRDAIIYVAKDTNKLYRWNGEEYVSLSEYLPLSGGTIDGELLIGTNNINRTTISGAVATHHYNNRNYTREVKVSSESVGFSYVRVQGSAKTNIDRNGVCHQSTGGIYGDYNPDGYLLEWPDDDFSDEHNHTFATREWVEENNSPLMEITWAALKALCDGGNLVPGRQYRITDYVCTVNYAQDYYSAGHPFDIIVTAISSNTLEEKASAIMHKLPPIYAITFNDSEVRNCYVQSYNPGTYNIVDTETLLGLKDVSASDIYLDGGNLTGSTDVFASTDLVTPYLDPIHFINNNLSAWELKYSINNDRSRFAWADDTNGKGVIYWMKDEFDNECPYDFKNILYSDDYEEYPVYTFNYKIIDGNTQLRVDLSLNTEERYGTTYQVGCHGNIIKPYYDQTDNTELKGYGKTQYLNWIYFLNSVEFASGGAKTYCNYNNFFNFNCRGIRFGKCCSLNSFDCDCRDIRFDNNCNYNQFGQNCENIRLHNANEGIEYVIVDSKCSYIDISGQTTHGILNNLHIHTGVHGSYQSVLNLVSDNDENYQVNYYPANSKDIILN